MNPLAEENAIEVVARIFYHQNSTPYVNPLTQQTFAERFGSGFHAVLDKGVAIAGRLWKEASSEAIGKKSSG